MLILADHNHENNFINTGPSMQNGKPGYFHGKSHRVKDNRQSPVNSFAECFPPDNLPIKQ